jgi:putative zinc finger/helix-turn-helix YgiT family protein
MTSTTKNRDVCPSCGESITAVVRRDETFEYRVGDTTTLLSAPVDVHICNNCGLEFTDERAERARNEAVATHLGLLTSSEIRNVRRRLGFNRREFAALSGIGDASLARWESGALLQSRAYDLLLRLLSIPANVELARKYAEPRKIAFLRLPQKGRDQQTPAVAMSLPSGTKFQIITKTSLLMKRASEFRLRCLS